jgi:hypothetical protein
MISELSPTPLPSRCLRGMMVLGYFGSGRHAKARNEAVARAPRLDQETARHEAELSRTRQRRVASHEITESLTTQVLAFDAENYGLRQTPHFYFDRAVHAERITQNANTDAADQPVVAAFREVVTPFPEAALAPVSRTPIAALQQPVTARAAAMRAAQASVVRLSPTCLRQTHAARAAGRNSMRFDIFLQVDMNLAMAGNRCAEAPDRAACNAKERASDLLAQIPDPGNILRNQNQRCDQCEE